jgi:hypothetical protein
MKTVLSLPAFKQKSYLFVMFQGHTYILKINAILHITLSF